ncbi:SDR family NAD(P)-dependent oxidoreductase [Actinomadura alba]|uniref:SDR family NAD(P)-dependent oxidoreductase n=1 Tax=Actinomadura alba TaxID=406431 RepID=A0ABR7LUU2_9ACTN|nr:SDR family NAD(P)-dependent oxidoreductase [Actinomadura alba]MBC6468267.1 SDR family NAD(P)-dependent oxidoreductase [Actinomadura alba]
MNMDLGLAGKVVLVTGASTAIGRATALAFAEEKAQIAVGYHSNANAAAETVALAEQRGARAIRWQLDLGRSDSLEAAVEHARKELGRSTSWSTTPSAGRTGPSPTSCSKPRRPNDSPPR